MNLLNHIVGIITKPKNEWLVIKEEPISASQLYTGYIAILALIPVIATFIGTSLIGVSIFGISYKVPIVSGLITAVISYILSLVGIYLCAFVMNALAPNFESTQNMNNALKLVAFSYTPVWIVGIFSLIPALSLLGILGLYGLYLLYIGLEPMMGTPTPKKVMYLVVTLVIQIVIMVVIGLIVGIFAYKPTYSSINF
jgi:hypothetical protein